MSTSSSIIDTRRDQMFPVLEPQEIERVRRFGKVRSYDAGEALEKVGDVGPGLTIILAGHVDITPHDQSGRRTPIIKYGPGSFMGELAQLAGQRALVDAHAQEPVEALTTCFGSRAFCAATAIRVKGSIPRLIRKPRR
jgi:thioredoxin reductase (NADPH)